MGNKIKSPIYQIFIHNHEEGNVYHPIIKGEVKITWERGFKAGVLEFEVIKDPDISYQEGNTVTFNVDGEMLFKGFVFRKRRNKAQVINTTCYDQLRYLKTKDTYQYSNKTMAAVIKKICEDRGLMIGDIEDTSYSIPKRLEENQEYLNMIKVANDITLSQTGRLFTLFDEKGKICLRSVEKMILDDCPVSYDNAVDFDYETSIDDGSYNRIVVYLVDDNGQQIKKIIKQDDNNIKRWGVLEYTVTTNNDEDIDNKASQMLEILNRKYRKLVIKDAIGDIRVRAGSVIPVEMMAIGDININSYMLVNKVEHRFKDGYHFMDLEVFNKDIQPIGSVDGMIKDKPKENKMDSLALNDMRFMEGGGIVNSDLVKKMLDLAFSKKGKPYVWSAAGPNAFDCSGFVSWVGIQAGLIPAGTRLTSASVPSNKNLHEVPWSDLQPGDILWVPQGYNKWTKKAGHVAIYAGDGKTIEAYGGKGGFVGSRTLNGKGIYAKVYRFNKIEKAKRNPTGMTMPYVNSSSSSRSGPVKTVNKMIRPVSGRVTSNFGPRWGRQHTGIDYGVPMNTPVKAAQGGTVSVAAAKGTYGNVIFINHPDGSQTRYAHLNKFKVKPGDKVDAGQVIALSGNTGRSTGPHLHFEVRTGGKARDPRNFV